MQSAARPRAAGRARRTSCRQSLAVAAGCSDGTGFVAAAADDATGAVSATTAAETTAARKILKTISSGGSSDDERDLHVGRGRDTRRWCLRDDVPGFAVRELDDEPAQPKPLQLLACVAQVEADDVRDDPVERARKHERHLVVRRQRPVRRKLREDDAEAL